MASPDGKPEELVFQKPDGTPYSRLEMDQQMREKWRKVQWMRILAGKPPYHLPKQHAYGLKEIELRHWILDAMTQQGLIVGDLAGVNLQSYNDENEKRQFVQRLTALIQSGQAVHPHEGEGVDMSNVPGAPSNGQPPMPPQGFTPPPAPPMGPPGFAPPGAAPQGFTPPMPPGQPPMPPSYAPPQAQPQGYAPQAQPQQQYAQPPQQYAPPQPPMPGMPPGPPAPPQQGAPQQAAAPAGGRRRKADGPPAPAPQAAPVPPMGPPSFGQPPGGPPSFQPQQPQMQQPQGGYVPPQAQPPQFSPQQAPQAAPQQTAPQTAAVDLGPVLSAISNLTSLVQQQGQQITELKQQVVMGNMALTLLSKSNYGIKDSPSADVAEMLKGFGYPIPQ